MYVVIACSLTIATIAWAIAAGDYSFAVGIITGVAWGWLIVAAAMAEASRS